MLQYTEISSLSTEAIARGEGLLLLQCFLHANLANVEKWPTAETYLHSIFEWGRVLCTLFCLSVCLTLCLVKWQTSKCNTTNFKNSKYISTFNRSASAGR